MKIIIYLFSRIESNQEIINFYLYLKDFQIWFIWKRSLKWKKFIFVESMMRISWFWRRSLFKRKIVGNVSQEENESRYLIKDNNISLLRVHFLLLFYDLFIRYKVNRVILDESFFCKFFFSLLGGKILIHYYL